VKSTSSRGCAAAARGGLALRQAWRATRDAAPAQSGCRAGGVVPRLASGCLASTLVQQLFLAPSACGFWVHVAWRGVAWGVQSGVLASAPLAPEPWVPETPDRKARRQLVRQMGWWWWWCACGRWRAPEPGARLMRPPAHS